MKSGSSLSILSILIIISFSCSPAEKPSSIVGTWKLQHAVLIEGADTTFTDYTSDKSFIKIINQDHFSFLAHDLNKGEDSTALFSAGGGRYTLEGSLYTEHLEYCNSRKWEDHDFAFDVRISGDTLIQSGIEEVKELNVKRLNTETYLRMK